MLPGAATMSSVMSLLSYTTYSASSESQRKSQNDVSETRLIAAPKRVRFYLAEKIRVPARGWSRVRTGGATIESASEISRPKFFSGDESPEREGRPEGRCVSSE